MDGYLLKVLVGYSRDAAIKIPDQRDNRELRPISGVSLKLVLDGKPLASRPPIHLLFAKDRGLRDGDWKLVSFQGEAWELYNVAEDRTELNDLAAAEPERLKKMIAMWNDMTKNVLHAPASASSPVTDAVLPHRHREWTNFDAETPEEYTSRKNRGQNEDTSKVTPRRKSNNTIRARKNTTLKIDGSELHLNFTGDDPGIAMDLRANSHPAGPYKLTFELLGGGKDGGEVFYTTKPNQTLPAGEHIEFAIRADGQTQQVSIDLPTTESLQQLRLDVSKGNGTATITNLRLLTADGEILVSWP